MSLGTILLIIVILLLIGAVQGAHSRISAVTVDDATEGFPWHVLHDLSKQCLSHVHTALQVCQTRNDRKCSI